MDAVSFTTHVKSAPNKIFVKKSAEFMYTGRQQATTVYLLSPLENYSECVHESSVTMEPMYVCCAFNRTLCGENQYKNCVDTVAVSRAVSKSMDAVSNKTL